jgi:hypothetical protein
MHYWYLLPLSIEINQSIKFSDDVMHVRKYKNILWLAHSLVIYGDKICLIISKDYFHILIHVIHSPSAILLKF